METNYNDLKYQRVQERVDKLKRFYASILKGLLAIIITGAINYYLNQWSNPWFLWVVFAVVLGLSLKAIRIFGIGLLLGKNWEERKIKELMDKDL